MSFTTITHKLFPGLRSSGNPQLDENQRVQADLLSAPYNTFGKDLSGHAAELARLCAEEARLLGSLATPSEVRK